MVRNNYKNIVPAVENYRDLDISIDEAFTWQDGIYATGSNGNGLVVVEFSSSINLESAGQDKIIRLFDLDELASLDAKKRWGFRNYFADKVSETGLARSHCIWYSKAAAKAASSKEVHLQAVRYAMEEGSEVYNYYRITKNKLDVTENGLNFDLLELITFAGGTLVERWAKETAI